MADIMIPALEADGTPYMVEKLDAHRRGLRHLAISAFVFDGDRLLLQRRALGKYHCGGLWANTVCTHPHWGEAPADCAARRLREELGIDVPLRPTGVSEYRADVSGGLIEHEVVHMFQGTARADLLHVKPDPEEVAETRWARKADLLEEVAQKPEAFTPWFRIYLSRWPDFRFGAAA